MSDHEFTGYFKIEGVPSIKGSGIAFGILYRDGNGKYWVYQSKSRKNKLNSHIIGMTNLKAEEYSSRLTNTVPIV